MKTRNMDNDQYRILEIIKRCLTGEGDPAEETELENWLEQSSKHRAFFDSIWDGMENKKRNEVFARINEKEVLKRWDRKIGYRQVVFWHRWVGYAAAIIVPVMMVLFLMRQTEPVQQVPEQVTLLPGKKQATLILSSGDKVLLQDSLKEIIRYSGGKVTNEKGNLVYHDSIKLGNVHQFNELVTPRGGEYQVSLADGTIVWLNADSRLKYPVTFDANNREVYVTGEAYFQVNKDINRPFYVVTDRVRIKVYGTEFNVNTRQQELFRTTLVNGKVGITVKATGQEMIMKPNQMFEYDSRTGKCVLKDVDVYTYIAWKFGEFVFEDNRLEEVMDQLKVWYDVEVFYAGEEVKNVRFTGDATRFTNIADILSIIEKTGSVGFKINGRMVTVYNKE